MLKIAGSTKALAVFTFNLYYHCTNFACPFLFSAAQKRTSYDTFGKAGVKDGMGMCYCVNHHCLTDTCMCAECLLDVTYGQMYTGLLAQLEWRVFEYTADMFMYM